MDVRTTRAGRPRPARPFGAPLLAARDRDAAARPRRGPARGGGALAAGALGGQVADVLGVAPGRRLHGDGRPEVVELHREVHGAALGHLDLLLDAPDQLLVVVPDLEWHLGAAAELDDLVDGALRRGAL